MRPEPTTPAARFYATYVGRPWFVAVEQMPNAIRVHTTTVDAPMRAFEGIPVIVCRVPKSVFVG